MLGQDVSLLVGQVGHIWRVDHGSLGLTFGQDLEFDLDLEISKVGKTVRGRYQTNRCAV